MYQKKFDSPQLHFKDSHYWIQKIDCKDGGVQILKSTTKYDNEMNL